MNVILRLSACLLAILAFSAVAAMAWDQGDRAAAGGAAVQGSAADDANR